MAEESIGEEMVAIREFCLYQCMVDKDAPSMSCNDKLCALYPFRFGVEHNG